MEWFETWFDSPYYPILYEHRDQSEAKSFLKQLLTHLALPKGAKILDVACGSGRHANFLAREGYNVKGIDLSPESIYRARQAHTSARFEVADMRTLKEPRDTYDLALNLFTSLGYFEDLEENEEVLRGIARALQQGGHIVVDFLNAERVQQNLVPEETFENQGVEFNIQRQVNGQRVEKLIHVRDNDQHYDYKESVQLLKQADFERLFDRTCFALRAVWGDYQLGPYEPMRSPRLILLAEMTGHRNC